MRSLGDDMDYIMSCVVILNLYYGFHLDFSRPYFYDIPDANGVMRHYHVLYNADFINIIPSISFDYKLIPSGRLVFAAKWKAHFNMGNGYEFYQAASIGGLDGLRGFRNQRFTGKTSYYQNTDIRFSLNKKRTRLLPMALGLFGGFDYGRVWYPGLSSERWHTSYGGGFFLNASDIISINTALFASEDGARFTFGLGFGF